MTNKTKIRVGVVGVGTMGEHHVRTLTGLAGVTVAGISDKYEARGETISKKYSIPFFKEYEPLFKEIDAAIIAAPTEAHFALGQAALSAGLRTLIEKPLALTLKEAESLCALAKKKGVLLSVGHIERFNPAYEVILDTIKGNKISSVQARRLSPFPHRIKEASVVLDMMIHDLDLFLTVVKSEITSVRAFGQKIRSALNDDVFCVISTKNGVVAGIEADRTHPTKVRTFNVVCDGITYEADLLNKKLYRLTVDYKEELPVAEHDQLEAELNDFLFAIHPRVSAEDGLKALALALEIESLCQ